MLIAEMVEISKNRKWHGRRDGIEITRARGPYIISTAAADQISRQTPRPDAVKRRQAGEVVAFVRALGVNWRALEYYR